MISHLIIGLDRSGEFSQAPTSIMNNSVEAISKKNPRATDSKKLNFIFSSFKSKKAKKKKKN